MPNLKTYSILFILNLLLLPWRCCVVALIVSWNRNILSSTTNTYHHHRKPSFPCASPRYHMNTQRLLSTEKDALKKKTHPTLVKMAASTNNKWKDIIEGGDLSPYSSQLAKEYKQCKFLHTVLLLFHLIVTLFGNSLPIYLSSQYYIPLQIHTISITAICMLLCHILMDAATYLRLNSDTYKRLNLGLLFYTILQLISIYFQKQHYQQVSNLYILLVFIVRLFTIRISFTGWIQGIFTTTSSSFSTDTSIIIYHKLGKELWQGIKQTLHGLSFFTSKKNKQSKTFGPYLVMVWACLGLGIQSILHFLGNVILSGSQIPVCIYMNLYLQ